MIAVVVLIIVCMILIAVSINIRLNGGAFFKYVNVSDRTKKGRIIPPSLWLKDAKPNTRTDYLVKNAADKIKDISSITYQGEKYIMSDCQGERLSDAYMDMLIFKKEFNMIDGFAVCEIGSQQTGVKRIKATQDEVEIPLSEIGSQPIAYVEKNRLLVTWDYPKMKELVRRNHNIHVFIDFTYDKQLKTHKCYKSIHNATIKIANDINTCLALRGNKDLILMYKIYIDNDGGLISDVLIENSHIEHDKLLFIFKSNIEMSDNRIRQKLVTVPNTKTEYTTPKSKYSEIIGFKMDEFIEFKSGTNVFEIQIEDSETLDKHKSNNIEFLLRVLNKIMPENTPVEETKYHNLYVKNASDQNWTEQEKELIAKAPKEVVAVLAIQNMNYIVEIGDKPEIIYKFKEGGTTLSGTPFDTAMPDFVTNYFKQKKDGK